MRLLHIDLERFIASENSIYHVEADNIAWMLYCLDRQVEEDNTVNIGLDGRPLGTSGGNKMFTIERMQEYLKRYWDYFDDIEKAPRHLFKYASIAKGIVCVWLGARRDSDEAYPIILLTSFFEDVNDKQDFYRELQNTILTVKTILDIVTLYYYGVRDYAEDDPISEKMQLNVSDIVNYMPYLENSKGIVKEVFENYKMLENLSDEERQCIISEDDLDALRIKFYKKEI